jgi:hypothetical protein
MQRPGHRLPNPLSVIAADFESKGQKLGPRIKSASLTFWTGNIRLRGNTRHILFEQKHDRIAPLRAIANVLSAGVNRAPITALAARHAFVKTAHGNECATTIPGGNQNAKVVPLPSLSLARLLRI